MPNIPTYEPSQLGIQPSEQGVDAFAQAGRRIGAAYSDMAEEKKRADTMIGQAIGEGIDTAGKAYDEWETHREIMTGGALSATMFQNIQNAWNQTARGADPNNPATAQKFREEVLQPALDDFTSHFTTERAQNWATGQVNRIQEHMMTKMAADQSSAAADAVTVNIKQTANSLSNAVRNDPTSLDFALETVDHSLGHMVDSSPSITPDVAARVKAQVGEDMKEQIVKSAVWGAIEKNPDAGLKLASDPRYSKYISGQEVTQAEAYARMQKTAAITDQERAESLRDKQARDASQAKANQILTTMGSDDPQEQAKVTSKSILQDPTLQPSEKLTLFRFSQQEHKPETAAQQSQEAYNPLLDRIYAPWGSDGKITNVTQLLPYKDKLTKADFNDLMKKIQDSQSEGGEKIATMKQQLYSTFKSSLNAPGGIHIENNDGLYRYRRWIDDQVDQSVRNNKDPSELFQPGNPRYLGSPQALSVFQKSLTQAMTEQAQSLRAPQGASPVTQDRTLPVGAPKDAQMLPDRSGKYHAYVFVNEPDIKTGKTVGKWKIWDTSGLLDRGQ